MPLYSDVHHKIEGLTREGIRQAHRLEARVQKKHGVKYLRYWYDTISGRVYCLVEAPSKEAAETVQLEAHGLIADQISEVFQGV